jgi:hypothetical protein
MKEYGTKWREKLEIHFSVGLEKGGPKCILK